LRQYETVFILDPVLDEIAWDKEVKKLEELIENNKGKIIQTQRWGLKKLSYHIKKKNEGYYVLIQFEAPTSLVRELDRYYKLNESCLRFLNVVLEEKKTALEKETTPVSESKEKV
jgi:small subunit ribosomal protein S6